MYSQSFLSFFIFLLLFSACDSEVGKSNVSSPKGTSKSDLKDTIPSTPAPTKPLQTIAALKESGQQWANIGLLAPDIPLDIRYATSNNFTKQQIYDCPKCLLRVEAAEALLEAKAALLQAGYGIKLFDCFRPVAAQERLWAIKPDKRYVTPPEKGSMHNRGAAVDITLTDLEGKELDMGTDFDVFSRKAWHRYKDLPEQVIDRRILLKSYMEKHGFKSITTEWWHYSYVGKGGYGLKKEFWDCD